MNRFARATVLAALVVCAGCSSFDAKWRAADGGANTHYATRWDGRWTSEHHRSLTGRPASGRLRCVLEPVDERRTRALFHANWLMFSSNYAVVLAAKTPPYLQKRGRPVELSGTHELPKMFGGVYRYDARISGNRFTARYTSSYDRGTFEMTRQLTKQTAIH